MPSDATETLGEADLRKILLADVYRHYGRHLTNTTPEPCRRVEQPSTRE
ncbi:hypothetical protein [Protofrankia symbiont of Coriaria ruscifolia]|nr:hypothetical protein [Protofrankia symbiont of Coriaria ruscifolia]